jgi:hypothetical protein
MDVSCLFLEKDNESDIRHTIEILFLKILPYNQHICTYSKNSGFHTVSDLVIIVSRNLIWE